MLQGQPAAPGGAGAGGAGAVGEQVAAYQGCLVHGHLASHPQPALLPPSIMPLEREWQAKRRRLLQRNIQIPASYYVARDPSLEEVVREQGSVRRAARQRYFSSQDSSSVAKQQLQQVSSQLVRRSASTSLPRKWSAPLPMPRSSSSSSRRPPVSHRHSLDLGGLELLLALPVPGRRVRPRECDELPDEFRRAGIGVCFKGNLFLCGGFETSKG